MPTTVSGSRRLETQPLVECNERDCFGFRLTVEYSGKIGLFTRFVRSSWATTAAFAACVGVWGTTWLGIKLSLTGLPPITGAGLRFVLAGALLFALGRVWRRGTGAIGRPAAAPLHLVLVLAITMFGINYALTYLAETHLASGLVAVLFGTMPFFIFGFAHAIVGERAGRNTIVGALLALAGVALISLVGNVRADLLYVVAALVASASSAFANVYLKKYSRADPLVTLAPAMLLAGAALCAWGFGFERIDWHRAVMPVPLAALAYLAVCGSALAFSLNHWLLQRIGAGTMGLSALMIPVVAVIVGAVFGGEVFAARDVVGALLVIGGVWLSMTRVGSAARAASTEATVAA